MAESCPRVRSDVADAGYELSSLLGILMENNADFEIDDQGRTSVTVTDRVPSSGLPVEQNPASLKYLGDILENAERQLELEAARITLESTAACPGAAHLSFTHKGTPYKMSVCGRDLQKPSDASNTTITAVTLRLTD